MKKQVIKKLAIPAIAIAVAVSAYAVCNTQCVGNCTEDETCENYSPNCPHPPYGKYGGTVTDKGLHWFLTEVKYPGNGYDGSGNQTTNCQYDCTITNDCVGQNVGTYSTGAINVYTNGSACKAK